MLNDIGIYSALGIVTHLVFIALAWWSLQALNYEKFLKKNHVGQARLLFILLAIALGSMVGNFFLD